MYVLGLDPSLRAFGWALHDTRATGKHRCVARGRFETNAKMLFVDRLVFLRESLLEVLEEFWAYELKIGMEQNLYDTHRAVDLGNVFAYTCEALVQHRLDMIRFTPKQIKSQSRHLIDWPTKLDMEKAQMVQAAKVDAGGGRWNHDEADAYHAARVGGRFWELRAGLLSKDDLSPLEHHLFLRTHTFVKGQKKGKTEKTGACHRENDRFFLWSALGDLDGEEEKNGRRPRGKKRRSI
jgi:hypothetical protein